VTAAILAFVVVALLATLSGVVGDEIRGWLELIPRGILRLVALRVPADSRKAIYKEEWLPEVIFILRKAEGGPITRVVRATCFAVSLAGAAAEVDRDLREGRNQVEGTVYVEPDLAAIGVLIEEPTAAAHLYIWLQPLS
jgi:hypothetical protein